MSNTMMLDVAVSGTPEDLDAIEALLAPLECEHEGGHFHVSRSAKAVKVSAGGSGGLPIDEMFAALNDWQAAQGGRSIEDVERDYIALMSYPDEAAIVRPDGTQRVPVLGLMESAMNPDAVPGREERYFASLLYGVRLR